MTENRIRLVVIDDHTLFRTGLSELLSRRGLQVVGMTGQSRNALALVEKEQPDIVLLDLRMPEVSGLQLLRTLLEKSPELNVVILTTSVEESDLLESLKSGAKGYLLKDMEPDGLVDSLRKVMNDETVVAPDLTSMLARAAVSREKEDEPAPAPVSNLTPREMEILCHIAKGQSNKEIARDLGITAGTVKLHVRAVMKKLDVQSRVQAAVRAISENLCDVDPKN